MEIEKTKENTTLTVKVIGKLNTTTSPLLHESLKDEFDSIEELILDFEELDYISSAGLRVLALCQSVMENEKSMKVKNVKESIMKILNVSGFTEILNIE